jgi:hypothetical protein
MLRNELWLKEVLFKMVIDFLVYLKSPFNVKEYDEAFDTWLIEFPPQHTLLINEFINSHIEQ